MSKVIFSGVINGEKFDNVKDYNNRLTELLDLGVDVDATSHTSRNDDFNVNDTITKNGNTSYTEYSGYDDSMLFPYFDDEDEYYLDQLVTNSSKNTKYTQENIAKRLEDCAKYIREFLNDDSVSKSEKSSYMGMIFELIDSLKTDKTNNNDAIQTVIENRNKAYKELQAAEESYNKAVRETNDKLDVLETAKPIIDELLEFYRDIMTETVHALANAKTCKCDGKCDSCKCEESKTQREQSQPEVDIVTDVKEKTKQQAYDFQSLVNMIFGSN